jgi:pimeloyl-ACP methyl ester carboxylesterase
MADYPVLVPTSVGLLGGVVSEPESEPSIAALFLPGWGTPRWGQNRVWARLGRRLADLGALVLRLDYPGWWDSDPEPEPLSPQNPRRAVQEATIWFRERAGNLDLLLVGECYGGQLALELAGEDSTIRGVAYVAPYFRSAPGSVTYAARRFVGPTLPLVRRALGSRVYPGLKRRLVKLRDPEIRQAVAGAAGRVPVWMLVGDGDRAAGHLDWLTAALPPDAQLDVETVPGVEVHTFSTQAAQDEAITRIMSWAGAKMGERLTT